MESVKHPWTAGDNEKQMDERIAVKTGTNSCLSEAALENIWSGENPTWASFLVTV